MSRVSRLFDLQLPTALAPTPAGRLTAARGPTLRATVPEVGIGDLCRIERAVGESELLAEVVGFDRDEVLLMPLGATRGLQPGVAVRPCGASPTVPCGVGVRGRVLDALGVPIDGRGPLRNIERAPWQQPPPNPMRRDRITSVVPTGVRALDGLLTLSRGQRIGLFAAAGGGKSTLLGQIARNIEADGVVLALIGERGREVRGFLEDNLGSDGMARSTVVVSTAEQPALLRLRAAYTATAIAEARRARGEHVVLMMDSVTRFARALREVGLAAGEPPGRQGYPASVFATLPSLFERAGSDDHGAITALYTVLVSGDDLEEPVADEAMSLLDGHVILSRDLAARGHYPAIDVLRSKSRLMTEIAPADHVAAAREVQRSLALFERNEDKIAMGLFEPGDDAERRQLARLPRVLEFLQQAGDEVTAYDAVQRRLLELAAN